MEMNDNLVHSPYEGNGSKMSISLLRADCNYPVFDSKVKTPNHQIKVFVSGFPPLDLDGFNGWDLIKNL